MRNIRYCFLFIGLLSSTVLFSQEVQKIQAQYQHSIQPIPSKLHEQMLQFTWHAGCPVAIHDLALVQLSHWGFDHKIHVGTLIVHKTLAKEIVTIFHILFEHQFPIERMEPVEHFQGNDVLSMAANNTSAFNCRAVTGEPSLFSQHSYGRAIDINPLINPYIDGQFISPPGGKKYVDRNHIMPGKIVKNDVVHRTFTQYGWDWAGTWSDVQDYQHFEKRAHGKKRNPLGYGKKQK